MQKKRFIAGLLASLLAVFFQAGCDDDRSNAPAATQAGGDEVTALVAASTTDAVKELADRFQKRHGTKVKISPGPSNQLATQIINGAPADVFLSANPKWAAAVTAEGLSLAHRDLLTNGLVIVVPKGNPAGAKGPADLAGGRVRRVALAGENVPAGTYAEQALKAAGIYQALVDGKKLARGHDVRATLAYVERGEAEAGVVYSTDAAISKAVETVFTFDPSSHEKIVYPRVLLKDAERNDPARRFYDYLGSPEAAEVFRKYGFTVLK